MICGEQIRAARSLLGWTQANLARKANVGLMTIKRLEGTSGEVRWTVESLVRVQNALEQAGIMFLAKNTEGGVGVRLRD